MAVVVMSLALMPLLGLLIIGHQGTANTVRQTQAFMLADDVAEAVAALDHDAIDSTFPDDVEIRLPMPPVPPGATPIFIRLVEVMPVETAPTRDGKGSIKIRPVKVTVVWEGPGDPDRRKLSLTALSAKVER